MRNLPQFRVGCWPLVLDDENKRTDKTPTHTGNVEWNGTKLPVVAWFREKPGNGKNGKPLPSISIQLDRQKLEYNYSVPRDDLQGENIVDHPTKMPRGEIDRLDRMEQALGVVLDAMMRADEREAESEEILEESATAVKH